MTRNQTKRQAMTLLLAMLTALLMLLPVSAKESLPSISSSKPLYTYTYSSSGKVYRYTDSSLKTKESGHWISCASDQCKIIEIQNNAVKVKYPTSSGEKTGWFRRSDFCKGDLKADQAQYSFKANKKITTYKWKENNTTYGYISNGDKVYLLRGDQNSSWLQVLYPVSGGYKMAWVKGDDLFANSIRLNKSSINRQGLNWTETLTATLSPSSSADSVTWKSSNTGVATVSSSGVVRAVGYGSTSITATTKRGKTASATVTISPAIVDPISVSLNSGNFSLSVGQTRTLTATVNPSNATNKSVTWASSNTNVASVSSSGLVTAKSAGSATITAKTSNGKTASITVTVVPASASLANGWYMIESGNSSNRVLDINNWSMSNGGNLEIYQKNGTSNQVFYVQNRGNGYYSIMAAHSGFYLHKANGGYKDDVHQWNGYGADNTQWALEDAGNGYFFVRSKSGNYLDNSGGNTQLGNNVGTYSLNYSAAQKWKFIRYDRPAFNGTISNHTALSGSYNKNSSKQISAQMTMSYPVTKLEVVVYNASGKNMGMTGTYYPNMRSFKLTHTLNFSNLAVGSYYYRIISYNVYSEQSSTDRFNFSIVDNTNILPTSVSLNSGNFSLYIGQDITLTATVSPSNATNKSVTWTSSNTSVATVNSNGKVTAKGAGSATITAKTVNGKTAKVTVTVKKTIVSQSEIDKAANAYNISKSSNAYKALQRINSTYANHNNISSSDLKKPLVFLFEGVGNNSSTANRNNAMCVVVKNNSIVYISRNCSTIPDHPFSPSYNGGTAMPTLKSGVYCYTTKNHSGKYAALNVRGIKSSSDAPVLRFSSKNKYSSSTSGLINVHYRGSNKVSYNNPPSSQGCQNILKSDYLKFCKAVGILNSSRTSITKYDNYITGKIIIDRYYAKSYLTAVGYPSGALNFLM